MKTCNSCKEEKSESGFHKDGKYHRCECKECFNNKRNQIILEKRRFVYNFLRKHPCVDCGETDIVVLQFDHIKDKKHANVSKLAGASGCGLDKLKSEIDKCEIVCANCHAKRTAKSQNWYASIDIKREAEFITYPFGGMLG